MSEDELDYVQLPSETVTALSLPVSAQIAVVNSMVLPLLKRTGIQVEVSPHRDGMTLALSFVEPPGMDADQLGTDESENARLLWALRDRIERARAEQPPASV